MSAMGKTAFMMYGVAVVSVVLYNLTRIHALGILAFGLVGGGLAIGAILLANAVCKCKSIHNGGGE